MEADDRFKLYYILTCSYPHLRQLKPKATFKATKDLHFKGLPDGYYIDSMTRMQGNRYLMNVCNYGVFKGGPYCVDLDTMTAENLALNTDYTIGNGFVDGEYILLVDCEDLHMAIFKDLKVIGYIEFDAKGERCKSDRILRSRYEQQVGHSVYALDRDARLYRIEWQDIKDGKYVKTLVKENVENFYVDGRLGLATLNLNHTLSLPSDTEVDLKANADSEATWTIVTCIAKCWIACGDRDLDIDGHAIMASVNSQGDIISTLTLKLTSNGYKDYKDSRMFAGIYSLHQAYVRGRRGIMLAIERDGCCHLISVAYGIMSRLQSIASIVNVDVVGFEFDRIVNCVTATGTKGEFIVGGFGWTRLISLKLK